MSALTSDPVVDLLLADLDDVDGPLEALDQPVPYAVTDLGARALDRSIRSRGLAPVDWLTAEEAAAILGVTTNHMQAIGRAGRVRSVDDGYRRWYDPRSVRAYKRLPSGRKKLPLEQRARRRRQTPRPRPPVRHLSVGPLLRQIEARGGPLEFGLGTRTAAGMALYRARARGSLTERAADQLATAIGLTPWEIWGDEWDASADATEVVTA